MDESNTTYLVPKISVGVVRDGKRRTVNVGEGFDFTKEEITAINKAQPGALRKPVNEGRGKTETADAEDGGEEAKSAKKSAKAPKATKAPAKAEDGDEDEDI